MSALGTALAMAAVLGVSLLIDWKYRSRMRRYAKRPPGPWEDAVQIASYLAVGWGIAALGAWPWGVGTLYGLLGTGGSLALRALRTKRDSTPGP